MIFYIGYLQSIGLRVAQKKNFEKKTRKIFEGLEHHLNVDAEGRAMLGDVQEPEERGYHVSEEPIGDLPQKTPHTAPQAQ